MKILITTDWYKPAVNGVVTSVRNLSDGLRAMGHEVKILTLSGTRHSGQEGDVVYIGSVGVGKIYPNARLRSSRGEKLVQELIDWTPDVVHSQCEFSTFSFARRIATACDCPLVHTYHTVYEDFTHYFSPSVRVGRFMVQRFSRHLLSHTDGVIAPTKKIRRMLRQYGVSRPVFVVPSGLALEAFLQGEDPQKRDSLRLSFGLRPEDFVLLYLGRLGKEKNIEELFALLSAAPADVKLLLVGDGPYRQELETLAAKQTLTDRVIFAGMVPPDRVADYYRLGDIFVSASQSETQGLTYLEAMASGRPILCRKDPCLEDVVQQGETGFVYETPEEFQHILHQLHGDPNLRADIGRAAQREAEEKFSTQGFASAALRVYARCWKEKRIGQTA